MGWGVCLAPGLPLIGEPPGLCFGGGFGVVDGVVVTLLFLTIPHELHVCDLVPVWLRFLGVVPIGEWGGVYV